MLRRKPARVSTYLTAFILSLLVFLFLIPSPVWGNGCDSCDCTSLYDDIANINLCCAFTCMLGNLATFLITAAPLVAVILLAFGGIKYMASAGDEKSLQSAKQFLTWVILGFLGAFGVVFIFRFIMTILRGEGGYIP